MGNVIRIPQARAGTYTIARFLPPPADFDLAGPSAVPINQSGTAIHARPLTTSSIKSVATGDVNGDGLVDIVVTTTTGTIELLRNLGGGSFAVTSYVIPTGTAGGLAVGDLDNNGRDDIVVSFGTAAGKVTVFRNDSGLTTKRGAIATVNGTGSGPVTVVTSSAHNLADGDQVFLSGVLGFPAVNGVFTITRVSGTTFTLNGAIRSSAATWAAAYGATAVSPARRPSRHHHITATTIMV